MKEKLSVLEFRDLGGIDPKGACIQCIHDNFENIVNAINELKDKIDNCNGDVIKPKVGRPKKEN